MDSETIKKANELFNKHFYDSSNTGNFPPYLGNDPVKESYLKCVSEIYETWETRLTQFEEMKTAIEAALRIKDLWMPNSDISEQYQSEFTALQKMHDSFVASLSETNEKP